MKEIAEQIQDLLPRERQFLHRIYSKVLEDYAYVWDEFEDTGKLRQILLVIMKLFIEEHKELRDLSQVDQQEFKNAFRELISNPDALLQSGRKNQIRAIEGLSIEEWIKKVRSDINTINGIIERYEISLTSKLQRLYFTVPNHEIILSAVKVGRAMFERDIKHLGFGSPHMSKVHSYEDVEVQAFVLGIPADLNTEEIAIKSYLTYGLHFADDIFDAPDLEPSVDVLEKNCRNIRTCLMSVGRIGKFAQGMIDKTIHKKGAYKGLHLMIYGSLVQKTQVGEKQNRLLKEFKEIGLKGVAIEVGKDIEKIRDIAYWTTTKTVLEILMASDPVFDMTRPQLWNIIYAPALYYHDIDEEKIQHEINFTEPPTIEEMINMINIAQKHIRNYPDTRLSQRVLQLRFLFTAFQNKLPQQISHKYEELIKYLEGLI